MEGIGMSWDWDRGSGGPDLPLAKDQTINGELDDPLGFSNQRDNEDIEIDRLRSDPAVHAMVAKRLKKAIGRTADIPIKCGKYESAESLAFGIVDGKVELVLIIDMTAPGIARRAEHVSQFRLTGANTSNTPQPFPCTCDADKGLPRSELVPHWTHERGVRIGELISKREGSRRTRLWLYKAGLAALAADSRFRPSVQLHT